MTSVNLERNDGVARLQLQSADGRNTLTRTLFDQLGDAIRTANRDPSINCIVISSATAAFSAGADLNQVFLPLIRGEKALQADDPFTGGTGVLSFDWLQLLQQSKPIITAIDGYAVGGGITAFLSSDFLLASENASFHFPFVKLGITPEMGASKILIDRVGLYQAKRLIYTSASLNAAQALEIGLVDELVPAEQLNERSTQLASQLATQPLHALQFSKQLLQSNQQQTQLSDLWKSESEALNQCFHHPHHHEAVSAFLEKRAPVFRHDSPSLQEDATP